MKKIKMLGDLKQHTTFSDNFVIVYEKTVENQNIKFKSSTMGIFFNVMK